MWVTVAGLWICLWVMEFTHGIICNFFFGIWLAFIAAWIVSVVLVIKELLN